MNPPAAPARRIAAQARILAPTDGRAVGAGAPDDDRSPEGAGPGSFVVLTPPSYRRVVRTISSIFRSPVLR
jgi:hypothetical protein